jgi:Family of unknown function (DUF5309)
MGDEIVWAVWKPTEDGIKSPSITLPTYDLIGVAEDVEDAIFNISPTDTPLLTMAKRKKATNTLHQWQTDALAAAATNRQVEGDDASFATATPTTMLANYTQIARKTVIVSRTADTVKKYGRAKELARLVTKYGKELKRDIEFALVQNQASSAGSTSLARSSAGLESMIAGNRVMPSASSVGTTPGYQSGIWTFPFDGTTGALDETLLVSALDAAWQDGGDPSIIMTNSSQKRKMAAFGGASKFAGTYVPTAGKAQSMVIGGVDLYISDFGEHKIMLNRHMRTRTVFCLDPEYISVAFLDGITMTDLAKTGDADKKMLITEFCLVGDNPDAHAKVADLT